MTATNWTVNGDAPTPITEFALPYDLFLYNSDPTNPVYLDDTRGMTASSGAILPPLATKIWKAGDPCFAVCASGKTAVLNASKNSGDLQDPAAIASSILQQGLASDIAQQIYITGAPPVDKGTVLASASVVNLPTNTSVATQLFNMAGFQSFSLNMFETNGTSQNTCRPFEVLWFADAGQTIEVAVDKYNTCVNGVGANGFPSLALQGAVKAPYMYMVFFAASTTTASTATFTLIGFLRPGVIERAQFGSALTNTSGAVPGGNEGFDHEFVLAGSYGAGTNKIDYPVSWSGPATMFCQVNNTSTSGLVTFTIFHGLSGAVLAQVIVPFGPPSSQFIPLYLPQSFLRIQVANATTSTLSLTLCLMMNST